MTETDIDLIKGLREQSPKAQKLLLQRYGNEVFAQVARLLPSTEDAEEVYQDVFVKVFRNIATYEAEKSSLRTWISRIATTSQSHGSDTNARQSSISKTTRVGLRS